MHCGGIDYALASKSEDEKKMEQATKQRMAKSVHEARTREEASDRKVAVVPVGQPTNYIIAKPPVAIKMTGGVVLKPTVDMLAGLFSTRVPEGRGM